MIFISLIESGIYNIPTLLSFTAREKKFTEKKEKFSKKSVSSHSSTVSQAIEMSRLIKFLTGAEVGI